MYIYMWQNVEVGTLSLIIIHVHAPHSHVVDRGKCRKDFVIMIMLMTHMKNQRRTPPWL